MVHFQASAKPRREEGTRFDSHARGIKILLDALVAGRLVGGMPWPQQKAIDSLRYVLVRDFASLSGQISVGDSVKRFPATGNFKVGRG